MKKIIFIDTETTGLLMAEGTDLIFQPHIIELFASKYIVKGKKLVPGKELHLLIKPPIQLPAIITKITGITDADLIGCKTFPQLQRKIAKFFTGTDTMVAHNLPFDLTMLRNEYQRLGKEYQFPYPMTHYCTVENSMHIKGRRLKLVELYQIATGKTEITNAHRADADVMAMVECFKYLEGFK